MLATLYRGLKLGSPDARATHNVNPIGPNWADDLASYAEHLDAIGIGAYPNYVSPRPLQTEVLIAGVEAAAAFAAPTYSLASQASRSAIGFAGFADLAVLAGFAGFAGGRKKGT